MKPEWSMQPVPKQPREKKAAKQLRKRSRPRNDLMRSVEIIRERSGDACEAWWPHDCPGRGSETHHLLMRSQGGNHDPENLVWICGPAHHWAHHAGAEAYEVGALRRRAA